MYFPKETERLRFREWRAEDIAPFAAMNADEKVMEFFPSAMTVEETENMIKRFNDHFALHGFGLYAVETKADNQFIGFIGLAVPRFEMYFTPCVEIGWRLTKESWGNGFATEGAKACLDLGFNELGLSEIYSFTSVHNHRSEKVMQRIGMQKSGEFEHPNLAKEHWLNLHVLYKIEKKQ
jgi:RimJ/RimL family protein N-acetyltransferase